ncbi:PEP-CTERM sorting domain-containing protein [Nostoc sp. PCC 7120 = FACHB-418]|uniref:PEP-CTERM sorting domain-containing protein n=1 Tax=Anabaena cylindrica FACHB-318 TaxID=2692880 RepID=A0ABR7ZG01_ANACY|nr:PEP-CTERM sorting domain-containing protein [Anabaena cylindrica FACHB-318]MBD2263190.1 PEP-CTERM sorting domain-containing protein [Anabaena sp. FACHB-709]MBD2272735.1 PEP-CTERM sorting domain-containing protein [Nostoc sp. PCC 7120 = FACHB-418]MBD2283788.1 PEP-CTERM sorting domain-containing protein [Anabaena cylindrica FACHB-170]MBD2348870.1 PEP-CTERM sorting domain-containing protein [Trichormus variabilis FACHB-171]HBW28876.1 PEP-CTERM sorting domain-containing protein [Nostoc sp. UBA8
MNYRQNKSLGLIKLITPLTLAGSMVMVGSISAQALQFNFTYAPGTTLDQMLGYEMAGKYWSNYLADDVTVNIFIEPTNKLPTNVIGGAIPGVTSQNFSTVYQKLQTDITSTSDHIALNSLYNQCQTSLTFSNGWFQNQCTGYKSLTNTYKNGLTNLDIHSDVKKINLTRANAKALGMISANDPGYDGYILVSNLSNIARPLSWNYFSATNTSSTIPNATLDFFTVAVHELTHTLGFISGIDLPEYQDLLTKKTWLTSDDMSKYGYLMDMFRLSENSRFWNRPDISVGVDTMLSLDGGMTKLGNMSSGSTKFGGDGNQGSHWKKDATYDGIMESSLGAGGTRKFVTNNDLTTLDILGWNLQQNNQDLLSTFNSAKSGLATKMGVTTSWMDDNPTQAALLLTPQYIDANNNGYDDRGESLNQMINSSGTYNWGWNGYWWGWNGYWWGWNGYWQTTDNLTTDGFWQNFAWETLDEYEHGDHDYLSGSSQSQSVPEPTTIFGLFGIAIMGIATKLKRRCEY